VKLKRVLEQCLFHSVILCIYCRSVHLVCLYIIAAGSVAVAFHIAEWCCADSLFDIRICGGKSFFWIADTDNLILWEYWAVADNAWNIWLCIHDSIGCSDYCRNSVRSKERVLNPEFFVFFGNMIKIALSCRRNTLRFLCLANFFFCSLWFYKNQVVYIASICWWSIFHLPVFLFNIKARSVKKDNTLALAVWCRAECVRRRFCCFCILVAWNKAAKCRNKNPYRF